MTTKEELNLKIAKMKIIINIINANSQKTDWRNVGALEGLLSARFILL